jgi:hypothetical protein
MTPEQKKAYQKEYHSRPEVKAKLNARLKASRSTPEGKIKFKSYFKSYYYSKKGKAQDKARKLRCNFNIILEQYNEMFTKQDGCCAICKKPQVEFKRAFAVDHDHKTGEIRGLLCSKCNITLGNSNDDVAILEQAIQYLNQYDKK